MKWDLFQGCKVVQHSQINQGDTGTHFFGLFLDLTEIKDNKNKNKQVELYQIKSFCPVKQTSRK